MRRLIWALLAASLAVGAVSVGLIWLDYLATRKELLSLLREQAVTVRETLAAAARSNSAAYDVAEAQLAARLLDNARFLRDLEGRRGLAPSDVEALATRSQLFRVGLFAADGRRELVFPRPGNGRGRGGQGRGWRGGAQLAEGLLHGSQPEAVSGIHSSRFGSGDHLVAGVRRKAGGAIVVSVDASAVAELKRPASLQALLEDVTRSAPELAYTVLESASERTAHGTPPPEPWPTPIDGAQSERLLRVGGRPVLELASTLTLAGERRAVLRLGLRLDGVARAERRLLARLTASLLALLALSALAFGFVALRERYGRLSARHARAEQALQRRERLAAMGELAGTVAHEIRNPLNAIAMSVQRLRREFLAETRPPEDSERAELFELLGVMEGETRRVNQKVQQFLDYARAPRLQRQPTDLHALLQSLVEGRRALAESRDVALSVASERAGQALVDPDQLRQALDNVLRNALEATPAGGRVELRVSSDARQHVIEVRDGGPGIAPEVLPRIFDLYFTTKPEGTGVGLAVTQQIVTAHGGTLEVDSRPGAGARFSLHLPRVSERADA